MATCADCGSTMEPVYHNKGQVMYKGRPVFYCPDCNCAKVKPSNESHESVDRKKASAGDHDA